MYRRIRIAAVALVAALVLPLAAVAQSPQIALILDASGSMWGPIEGENKILIARRVLKDVLKKVPPQTGVGLVAYGHRRKADCGDIETVVPYGSTDRGVLTATIDAVNPKGKTPITAALEQVFGELKAREDATTVILVSDGLETCGGDPCKAVRAAKEAGIAFLLHVVGFDLGQEENVAQLECAALAGDGLYLTADNAGELTTALEQAIEITSETPTGKLSVKTVAEGKLADTMVEVIDPDSGEVITAMRTYASEETNPRVIPLPDGTYDVAVEAVRIAGRPSHRLDGISVQAGETVEKVVEFGSGTVRIGVTRNGELTDATVNVYQAGTRSFVVGGRTYRAASSNPLAKTIASGTYDIEVKALEIANKPEKRWEGIALGGGEVVSLEHAFESGGLSVGARNGTELVDAVVSVYDAASGHHVTQSRTYTSRSSNPKSFELAPGNYVVKAKPIKKVFAPRQQEVRIEKGATVDVMIDWVGGE